MRRFEDFYRQQRDQLVRALSASGVEVDLAAESVDEAMARALEGWKELEIAPGAVKSRVHRALARLNERLA